MNINLEGKKALICGSTQGIGKASAIEIAQSGASVTLIARNEAKLKNVLATLATDKGQQHDYLIADFSKSEDLKQKIQTYVQEQNEIHILVNNTGGPTGGAILEAKTEEFVKAYEQHVVCNHILVQHLVPLMQKAKYGRIINIISTSVKEPIANLGVSNTTRWAVASWAKTLAGELGKFNITVNNVLPGFTDTARLQSIIKNRADKLNKSEEEIAQNMKSQVPMQRFAAASEVANAIAFLASPAASYINGSNINVDGGRVKSL